MRLVNFVFLLAVVAPVFGDHHEFHELFDGQSIEGWVKKGGEATYEVQDGAILGTTKPNTPNTFLCPPKQYADFELTFDTKCDASLNSGVQIRSADSLEMLPEGLKGEDRKKAEKRGTDGSLTGPQVEIAANGNAGGVWFEGVGGWGPEPNPELANEVYKAGEWNAYRVLVVGDEATVFINGQEIASGSIARTHMTKGWLGFQVHGVGKRVEPLQVRWKNIKIREL